jgi:hypothetical protein
LTLAIYFFLHIYMWSDHCSLFDLLGYFWPKSKQCRSWSDGMDGPTDLDLHCLHIQKMGIL